LEMTLTPANKDLLLYLDSTRDLYPTGIARANKTAKLMFVAAEEGLGSYLGAEPNWSGEKAELLEAAVIKGLKLPISEVCVLSVSNISNAEAVELVEEKVACLQARVVVVLGLEAAKKLFNPSSGRQNAVLGEETTLCGTIAVCTCELTTVLKDSAKKKEFWQDLKKVIKYLA